jgi:hypothetical protein
VSFEVAPLEPGKRFFKADNSLVSHWILGVCRNSKVDEKSIAVLFFVNLYTPIQRLINGIDVFLDERLHLGL